MRHRTGLVGPLVVVLLAASCSSNAAHPVTNAAAARRPVTSATGPTTSVTVGLPASAIADPGLPATVGEGPLTQAVVQQLMQYFEDHVAEAYADNDPDALYRYLAGDMLTGNRGTVNVFSSQGERNVFSITVTSVSIDTNEATRVTFDMMGDETSDYFMDTTGSTLVGGAPGPSQLSFLMFIDFNPTNHTWYWTGAENTAADSGSDGDSASS